jgi:hypothetical protein
MNFKYLEVSFDAGVEDELDQSTKAEETTWPKSPSMSAQSSSLLSDDILQDSTRMELLVRIIKCYCTGLAKQYRTCSRTNI